MTNKVYLSAQQLLEDSFALGAQVIASGFRPTFMIAIWRGGTPYAMTGAFLVDVDGDGWQAPGL